jgi:hypothetical protein
MQRVASLMTAAWLMGAAPVFAQGLPDGTFASTKEGCAKLVSKTPAELGADLNFNVLTRSGVTSYLQRCDFFGVTAHDAKSWVATAFCDEQGYIYPDLFAVAEKEEGKLSVTRVTDLTQEPYEGHDDRSSIFGRSRPFRTRQERGSGKRRQQVAFRPRRCRYNLRRRCFQHLCSL